MGNITTISCAAGFQAPVDKLQDVPSMIEDIEGGLSRAAGAARTRAVTRVPSSVRTVKKAKFSLSVLFHVMQVSPSISVKVLVGGSIFVCRDGASPPLGWRKL